MFQETDTNAVQHKSQTNGMCLPILREPYRSEHDNAIEEGLTYLEANNYIRFAAGFFRRRKL
jgi:hypothetical protein